LSFSSAETASGNWPRWRGADGNAVSSDSPLPVKWSASENVQWKVALPGEGSSSPIVWEDRVFLTCALEEGTRRVVLCLDRKDGKTLWRGEISDDNPELTSSVTGHAAATPATDGKHVVAFFGNAGAVCYDFTGKRLWRRSFGEFDSELGLASSPIIYKDLAILVCDHDGDRFKSFDSFLIALDVKSGETRWKTDRHGLFRSWSTPILAPAGERFELIVNAQDELRGYDPDSGRLLWQVGSKGGWVTPSPVFGKGIVYSTSGKDGPTLAVRPGGRGDVTATHVAWTEPRGGPYVCSPLLYGEHLYVHNELGILTCKEAGSGKVLYRKRLGGKFTASAVAGDGKLYLTNEAGTTFVVKAGAEFELLAENRLDEYTLASPAISRRALFLRAQRHLYCIGAHADW
jgi:outer membrane protein assembly factor BamB